MYHIMDEESPTTIWKKLESWYMSKSLTNKLYLKHKLFYLEMSKGKNLNQHIVDVKFDNENKTLMLLNSLLVSSKFKNLVTTLMCGKETIQLEEIISKPLSFNIRKKAKDENSQGEGLVVRSNQKHERNKS
ncbi:hypothetical protein NC653_017017 [Populus alba x Populus x berolinensis]|uniref:Uncharacterized protein n=1 Tax=Populus alba x Populus x berolinensis TaxID=444605 RepID=A0AAD6VZX4_9ROSI|nr:hypothetical protein NC653_017017 [Populus alba x Populus x berolinensis]